MNVRLASFLVALLTASFGAAQAQDKVRFPSHDADLTKAAPTGLEGLLYRPAGDGPFPAVVLLHGCGGLYARDGNPSARHDDWARRFRDGGYVALLVDSFRPRGVDEICTVSARTIQARRERARDAYGALLYLQQQAFVHADRIALMGWSNGGSTTLWTILNPISARPKSLRHDFAAAVALYPACRQPLDYRAGWKTRIPLLILIGENDDWTPAGPCIDFAARTSAEGSPVAIHVYPHAYHDFDAPNTRLRVRRNIATTATGTATVGTDPAARADAIERVPAFLARHLKP